MDDCKILIMIDKRLSYAITQLRGTMAFLIICVHADFTGNFSYRGNVISCEHDFGYHIVNFVAHNLSDFAVPLFFLISGILYYNSAKLYSYRELIKKKVKTLLFPYLAWNTIFFFAFFITVGYSFLNFIQGLWYIPRDGDFPVGVLTQPWDGPLWFLRDLIIVFLIAPIIKWLTCKIKVIYIALLLFIYMTKLMSWYVIPGVSITSILMFSIGIYLAQTKYDWLSKIIDYRKTLFIGCLIMSIITYIFLIQNKTSLLYNLLHSLYILFGVFAALSVAGCLDMKSSLLVKSGKYSFVVFASHTMFLNYVIKMTMIPFGFEIRGWQTPIIYFTSVTATYLMTCFVGFLISQNNILNKILAGGR